MNFEKSRNFRDLGGIRTMDGRTVKHGCFYRSGMLCRFTDEDEKRALYDLGIRVVLDFRSRIEAAREPDIELPEARYYNICALLDADGEEMAFAPRDINHLFEDGVDMCAECDKMIELMYSEMAFNNPAFRKLFEEMAAGNVPILFHCSAGKDRTGVAAMLILFALGADEEAALDDYMLTNEYRREAIDALIARHEKEVADNPKLKFAYTMMEGVDRAAGELVISRIKKRYGDFDRYFENEFGLFQSDLERLRDMYLE